MKYLNKKVINSISILLALLILAMLIAPAMPVLANATQSVILSANDRNVLLDMISNIARDEGVRLYNCTYTAKKIYLASERQIGYVVDFDFDKSNGYAIVLTDNGFDIAEISLNEKSPFCGKEGKYIYPALGAYFTKNNGVFYDLSNNASYPKLNIGNPDAFFGSRGVGKSDYVIIHNTFNSGQGRDPFSNTTDLDGYPKYRYTIPDFYFCYDTHLTNNDNSCANVAALTIINHWNKYYGNDILNYNLSEEGDINNNDAISILNDFYYRMKTNINQETRIHDFYNGLSSFIRNFGYQTKVTRYIPDSDKPSFSTIKQMIKNNLPIVICSDNYYFALPFPFIPNTLNIEPNGYDTTWGYNYYDL